MSGDLSLKPKNVLNIHITGWFAQHCTFLLHVHQEPFSTIFQNYTQKSKTDGTQHTSQSMDLKKS